MHLALLTAVVVTVTSPSVESGMTTEQDASSTETGALAVVLSSCRTALGVDECASAEENREEAVWNAEVVFSDDGAQVTLRGPTSVDVRNLEFLPEDSKKQRQVAAGLLVAAMTASARLAAPEPETTEVVPPPVKPKPLRAERLVEEPPQPGPSVLPLPTKQRKRRATGGAIELELAALGGPILGASHVGLGGWIGLTGAVSQRLGGSFNFGARHSSQSEWRSTSMQICAGPWAAVTPPQARFGWRISAEAVVDQTAVSPAASELSAKYATRFGGRVRSTLAFDVGPLAPFVGFGVAGLTPTLKVRDGSRTELSVPDFLGFGYLGVSYNLAK